MSPEATLRGANCDPMTSERDEYFAFPLTLGQAAMLPEDLNVAGDPRFNGAFRMNLAGRVDALLLERSLREIAQRHESLRTTFRAIDGKVQQVIFPESDLTLEFQDLRSLSERKRLLELEEICLQEAHRRFDLTQGTPFRAKLLQLRDEQFMLTLTLHQIICDGWSIGVIMEELARIYSAFAEQKPSPLLPLAFQFGDYVVWQRENASRIEAQAQLEYWKEKLANYRQFCVAADYAATAPSINSDIVSRLLPRDLAEGLRSLSEMQNTTFFVVTMAACIALLHRYTGKGDLALRTPLAGRSRVEFEGIIGQLVNHVVIRVQMPGDLIFSDLLATVRESVWEALSNQDVPFEEVLQKVEGLDTSTRRNISGVNFICQREYGRSGPFQFELDGVRMSTVPSKSQGALYDLNFFLVERDVGWRLSLEYKTDLYGKSTAESLLQHFEDILREIAADPTKQLSQLALTETEALKKRIELKPPSVTNDVRNEESPRSMETQAMPGSFAQERFWALSQIDPCNPTFHIPVAMRLEGELSALVLEQCFKLLIERHEILRTTFSEIDGEFMQIIRNACPFKLEVMSLEGIGVEGGSSRLQAIVQTEVKRPFDLASLPLFRALLCRLNSREHVLVVTIHHVLADAWSVQVLQRELWTAYESLKSGQPVSLTPLHLQYGDFSVWQRESVGSELMTSHLDFWIKSLAGELPVLNFPTDHAPGYQPTSRGAVQTLLLPGNLSRSLKQLAQSSDSTLFVITLACFAAVLARATDAQDLIIGSPVVNRRLETEPLIGPFAGPIALRLRPSGNPTLREFIRIVRDATLEALEHADLPFEMLLERLTVRPAEGRSPLFQFYFFCQPAFLQSRNLADLTVTPLPSMSLGTPFEMQLGVIERQEGIRAEMEYDANLFNKSTIEKWLAYYETVLESLVANPDQNVSDLPHPPARGFRQGNPGSWPDAAHGSHTPQAGRPLPFLESGASPGASPAEVGSEEIHDALTAELTAIWKDALNLKEIGLREDFFVLGGRSLIAARLIARINRKYALTLGLSSLFNFPTIEGLAQLIRGRLSPGAPSSIVAIHAQGSATPLFMIHGVRGNVLNFYDLAKELGPDQPVYGVEAQSLLANGTPLTTLEDLAAYYVREVRQVQPYGPYNVLGYSYGGLVAFEMARQLQSANEKVALLGMLDTPVWRHSIRKGRGTLAMVGRQLRAVWSPFLHRLRPCTPMEIFDGMKSTILRAYYTLGTSYGQKIPKLLRSVYHINSFAAVNYVPTVYNGKITMLRASAERGPSDLGWGKFTTEPVEVFEIPGAHLQVLSDENMPKVIQSLQKCLGGSPDRRS